MQFFIIICLPTMDTFMNLNVFIVYCILLMQLCSVTYCYSIQVAYPALT